ncbi:MAG TPA: NHL repeat-containing protein [Solirubrobacteraceae bacterium]
MRDHILQMKSTVRRPRRWAILPALACLLVLSVGGGVAQAASFGKLGEFGEAGTAGGQFSEVGEESPRGIAVDPGGDLWVVDGGNARVQKLEPSASSASFLFTFGWGVQENHNEEFQICTSSCGEGHFGEGAGEFGPEFFGGGVASGVAVEPSAPHDLYVTDTANKRVEKFEPDGKYFSEFNGHETPALEFASPRAVTVDSSGHVYVMDAGHQVVDRFSSTGTYECQITGKTPGSATECNTAGSATPQEGFNVSNEASRSGANLAVDSSGDLYVAETGIGPDVIDEFKPSGEYVKQFTLGEGGRAVAVDSSGDVFAAGRFGREIVEFDPAVSLTAPVAEFGNETIGKAAGIATTGSGTSERVYVTDREFHKVWIFGPVITPECTTESAEGETATGATLTGTVNPLGLPAEYQFKYGTTTGYGGETPLEPAGEGAIGVKHSKAVSSLQPHQEYHYELVATNTNGSSPCGDKTLKTLSEAPLVSGEQAGSLTQTAATLEAQVNPNNEEAHYYFEYSSTSSSLSSGVTTVPALPGGVIVAGYGNVPISQPLSPLAPNTPYYYRAVASNTGGGTRQGTIESFLTLPATPTTGGASDVAQSTATVAGSFNPGGHDTHWYFEYGTAACAPTSCGERTTAEDGGAGTSPVEPKGALTKLQPLTTYHYRLVVANSTGPAYGPEEEVTTLPQAPAVITDPPISVTPTSATIAGEVVPQCVEGRYPPTTYRFEFGTSTAYGTSSGEAAVAASSCATGGEAVTASLAGLLPNTVYHYRLDATNSGGETQGKDRTFTTNASGQPASGPLSAGFSLTGPPLAGPTPFVFPDLSTLSPLPSPPVKTTITPKALTKAQKLVKALKACERKPKKQRAGCIKQAKSKYAPSARKKAKRK